MRHKRGDRVLDVGNENETHLSSAHDERGRDFLRSSVLVAASETCESGAGGMQSVKVGGAPGMAWSSMKLAAPSLGRSTAEAVKPC